MKKIPALLCTAALIAGLLPLSSVAAEKNEIPVGTQQLITKTTDALIPCKGGAVLVSSETKGTSPELGVVYVESSAYTCDSAGRILTKKCTSRDFESSCKYDENGTLLTSMDPSTWTEQITTCSYIYDADGRLTSYESAMADYTWHYDYDYDTDGRLQTETLKASAYCDTITYGDYDENGNPCSYKGTRDTNGMEWAGRYSYDANGWLSAELDASGKPDMTYTRDSYGNVTSVKYETQGESFPTTYTYDSFGNILTKTTEGSLISDATMVTTYTYTYPKVSTPATPVTPAPAVVLSPQNLSVDGKAIACEKYNIDGANYFKLRDLASLLNGTGSQFNVGYDAAANTVTITKGEAYTAAGGELVVGKDQSATAVVSEQAILIDGKEVTSLSVYNIGGNNYFKLRDLGEALGFGVDYDEATNTAIVTSTALEAAE